MRKTCFQSVLKFNLIGGVTSMVCECHSKLTSYSTSKCSISRNLSNEMIIVLYLTTSELLSKNLICLTVSQLVDPRYQQSEENASPGSAKTESTDQIYGIWYVKIILLLWERHTRKKILLSSMYVIKSGCHTNVPLPMRISRIAIVHRS